MTNSPNRRRRGRLTLDAWLPLLATVLALLLTAGLSRLLSAARTWLGAP
jgi:hypothetical protein